MLLNSNELCVKDVIELRVIELIGAEKCYDVIKGETFG